MSWDNVEGVSSVQIWTDNPDMTQAYLFANGNHQVKLTIGVSLSLSGEGPTYEEVKTALSLIDFETGAGISHLKTGDKGEYAYVYQPNEVSSVKVLDTDASGTGAYQYEVDYYLSSDSTINENYASEKVALLLTYIDGNGNKIDYQTASGSKSQSYVAVTVYPPKKYGLPNSNSTSVTLSLLDDKPDHKVIDIYQYVQEVSECHVKIFKLYIDDSYFRIIYLEGSDEIFTGNPFNIKGSKTTTPYPYDEFRVAEHYICKDNRVNQGTSSYSTQFNFMYNITGINFFTGEVSIYQQPNDIIFLRVWADVYAINENYSDHSGSLSFSAYDQFGNKMDIEVKATDDGFTINSVT